MSISADLLRGHTDTMILRFLCEGDSYGYEINKKISSLTDGTYELNEATLYTAFRRLEKDGCIESYWGDEQSGARRKYYHITEYGKDCYIERIREWEISKRTIERLIKL